jgi:hypothetical protein
MPTAAEALAYCKRFIGNLPVDDSAMKYRILNAAHNRLWMAAPWSWTVGAIPVVTLANDTQDYTLSPAISDFQGLIQIKLKVEEEQHDLAVVAQLPSTTDIKGKPSQVAYVAGALRVMPVPTGYSTVPKVYGWYKKTVTPIAAGNEGSGFAATFGLPDEWFWVFEELVMLKAMAFAHSPKLGSVTTNNGQIQHSGQYGVVEAAIAEMRRAEEKFLTTLGEEVR